MTTTDERPKSGVGKQVTKTAGKHLARKLGWLAVAKLGFWVLVVLCLLVAIMAAGAAASKKPAATTGTGGASVGGGANAAWDPANIISDTVFYNGTAMTAAQIQTFLDAQHCSASDCLKSSTYSWTAQSGPGCQPVAAGSGSFASLLATISVACSINPQVTLVVIEKESQGLDRSPPAALTGSHCPDSTGCDPAYSGVFLQTWGFVSAAAKLHVDPSKVNYIEGQSHDIQYDVAPSCGSSPVTVANRATATLYTWTPYQPNQASLDAYPGTGDGCSSYGNRNFFRMFQKYFGDTGGGKAPAGQVANAAVVTNGVAVTIPDNQYVTPALRGQTIQAPTAGMAKGLAAGFSTLGTLYVWGGGFGPGGAASDGCARGGGALNSCKGQIGWDCSGLVDYVYEQGGYPSPGGESNSQRSGPHVPFAQGVAGDVVGFSGHVAVFIGTIGGVQYILEASDVGIPNHVVPLTRTDHDAELWRHWT